jgi:molybdopterin-guanine dinucleotide biosynthesis protein A
VGQESARDHEDGPAPVWGLVLAGGASRRMGGDKGGLSYHGITQAEWTWQQLDQICERAYISVNSVQQGQEPYASLPTITDEFEPVGPATGLLSAWSAFPQVAWLVVAVDMPFLDRRTLKSLVDGRCPTSVATAFQHSDGTLEPLCAIWEAAAQPILAARVQSGDASLRRCLEAEGCRILRPPVNDALISVNSPAEYQDARRRLEAPIG